MGVACGKPHPSNEVLGISKREAVMVTAGECVRREEREKEKRERKEKMERERRERREERERRRRENRAELVKQLEEADLEERKDRSKVHISLSLSLDSQYFSLVRFCVVFSLTGMIWLPGGGPSIVGRWPGGRGTSWRGCGGCGEGM